MEVKPDEIAAALQVLLRALAPAPTTAPGPAEPWLTLADAAGYAQVSDDTLRGWMAAGLRYGQVGRVVRFRRVDVDEWLLSGGKEVETEKPEPEAAAPTPSRVALSIVNGLKK